MEAQVRTFADDDRLIIRWTGRDDVARRVVFDRGPDGQGLPVELAYDGRVAEVNVAANVIDITRLYAWETSDISYQGRFLSWRKWQPASRRLALVRTSSEILIPPEGEVYDGKYVRPLDYTFGVTRWYWVFDGDDGFYYHQRIEPGGPLRPVRWTSLTRLTHFDSPVEGLILEHGVTEWHHAARGLSGTQVKLLGPGQFEADCYGEAGELFEIAPGKSNGGFAVHSVLRTGDRRSQYSSPIRYSGVHFVAGPDDLTKPRQCRARRYTDRLAGQGITVSVGPGSSKASAAGGVVRLEANGLPCRLTLRDETGRGRVVAVWVRGAPRAPRSVLVKGSSSGDVDLPEGMLDTWKEDASGGQALFFVPVGTKTEVEIR